MMNDFEFVEKIIAVTAREAGLKRSIDLLSGKRELYVCKYRDDAIFLAKEHTTLSWERLAILFGKRHHTTLIGAHRRVQLRLERNPPRKDSLTWAGWHKRLLDQVQPKEVETK